MRASGTEAHLNRANQSLRFCLKAKMKDLKTVLDKAIKRGAANQYVGSSMESGLRRLTSSLEDTQTFLTNKLLHQQTLTNQSAEYIKLIREYERKVLEYRLKCQTKDTHFEETKSFRETLFADECFLPNSVHMRKFFIEALHRQKLQKILDTLSALRAKLGGDFHNMNEHSSSYQKSIRQANPEKAVIKLIEKIKEEEKRSEELSKRFVAYQSIVEVVQKQNQSLQQQLSRKHAKQHNLLNKNTLLVKNNKVYCSN